ncbi:aminoglycoside nucleotidyltransferase ANT9 [Halomonas elongata]|uniref:Aminoglycoside nucleotidyltransferase ANT9 n=1 Tax=Halomonas elongata (strain ATCC 33173 / DSM 2581 / NBRC 15536 / NCIMB 2198 / 1H9) TaxID=768066 RepID=A0A1R4A491_HALED|nr:aminoglycoside nucleotidyltransferase ANT9 [Halomonas elongata]WBF19981.1 aminoglycoside nucleotidyltransferase ANT9 [Halomonas elongata]WPU49164.1 aminoglycoside nucleotidyltransferase ANT9 [Halomonas elongata DSM 2581]SJK83782.1 spectinomycin adenyltransferase [Halomonas elongata DSM 2581]
MIPDEAKKSQSVVEELLGDSVIGIYLFGSAVDDSLTIWKKKALVAQLMNVSGTIGNQQSIRPIELTVVAVSDVVPWQFPPRAEFVYGEWLREEFEAGSVPEAVRDPDLAIVLKKVIDNSLPLYGADAANVFEPVPLIDIRMAISDSLPNLLAETAGDERNVVLTLSRMWLTAATGDIAPKDTAAHWVEKQALPEHSVLLQYAREGYLGKVEDRWEENREEFEALVSYMRKSIEACLNV